MGTLLIAILQSLPPHCMAAAIEILSWYATVALIDLEGITSCLQKQSASTSSLTNRFYLRSNNIGKDGLLSSDR